MIRVAGCACCRHYASAWICQLRERRVARTASQGGKLRQDLHSIDCSTLQQVASATIHTTPQSRTPGNADENCDPPALRSRHRPRASVPRTAAEQLRPYIRRPARVACEECAAENTRDTLVPALRTLGGGGQSAHRQRHTQLHPNFCTLPPPPATSLPRPARALAILHVPWAARAGPPACYTVHETLPHDSTLLALVLEPAVFARALRDFFVNVGRVGAIELAVLEARRRACDALLQLRLRHLACTRAATPPCALYIPAQ